VQKDRLLGVLDETGHAAVIKQAIPLTGKGQVLVKVHASLISPGTELSVAKKARFDKLAETGVARPFGYQNAGEVVEVGEGVTEFKCGDRVACMGDCAHHSNYAVIPKNLCCKLPENVSYEAGAFAHLGATALNAIRRGKPEIGEYVLVVGLGLVGQLCASLGKIAGTSVMGWDPVQLRCRIAAGCGIDDTAVLGQEDEIKKAQEFTRGLGF
jgi:threonine dehydrogenase-like Zn-dependent dehydrogenase